MSILRTIAKLDGHKKPSKNTIKPVISAKTPEKSEPIKFPNINKLNLIVESAVKGINNTNAEVGNLQKSVVALAQLVKDLSKTVAELQENQEKIIGKVQEVQTTQVDVGKRVLTRLSKMKTEGSTSTPIESKVNVQLPPSTPKEIRVERNSDGTINRLIEFPYNGDSPPVNKKIDMPDMAPLRVIDLDDP